MPRSADNITRFLLLKLNVFAALLKAGNTNSLLRDATDNLFYSHATITAMEQTATNPHRNLFRYFRDNLAVVLGLVIIWRGMWYILDGIDLYIFNGNHVLTAVPWLIVGLLLLYLPDHDLKELGKL